MHLYIIYVSVVTIFCILFSLLKVFPVGFQKGKRKKAIKGQKVEARTPNKHHQEDKKTPKEKERRARTKPKPSRRGGGSRSSSSSSGTSFFSTKSRRAPHRGAMQNPAPTPHPGNPPTPGAQQGAAAQAAQNPAQPATTQAQQQPAPTSPQHQQPSPNPANDIAAAIALLTALAAKSRPDADLATHLREAAAEKDEPWRKRRAAIKRRTAGWDEEFAADPAAAWAGLRQHFAKAGSNALLDEDRAQELAAILCTTPLQQYRRARALLQLNASDRMALHNFTVAALRGESFTETWGPVLENLPVPLFPATPDHEDTNQKLLAQMAGLASVSGAGPGKHPRNTVFARPVATGAGYKAPVEDGAVDLGIVENAFSSVEARLAALEAGTRNDGTGKGKGVQG